MYEKQNNVSNSLLAEHDYLASEKKQKTIERYTPLGKRPIIQNKSNQIESGEEDNVILVEDNNMDEAGPSNIPISENVERIKSKRKKGKAILPVLATKATPYDIAEDLANMKTNITVVQLIETSPAQ